MTIITQARIAVLIDAENISGAHASSIMDKVATYGHATIRHAYGDWTTPSLQQWKKSLEAFTIKPCQQFRHIKGKNSSDLALAIDAMDMIHQRMVDAFCIVSSDSDFAWLAARLREGGMRVYGFGTQQTLRAFMVACDEFTVLGGGEV